MKGTHNMLKKLEQRVAEGEYYEAQQLYKTTSFRYSSQKRFDEALALLKSGACIMLKHKKIQLGTELASLFLQCYTSSNKPVMDQTINPLIEICECYPTDAEIGRITFLKNATKWSTNASESSRGDVRLHSLLAMSYWKSKDYIVAAQNFILGNTPEQMARMLVEWSAQGLASEKDLFIARAVLQYLALGNLRDANIVFSDFVKLCEPAVLPSTPLMNLLRFLLATLEREAYELFAMLRDKYAPSLERDLSFSEYLDQTALTFFPKQQPGGR